MTQPLTALEVLNTVGYEGFVRSLYNRSGDLSKDFAHAVLGIVTETHEYLDAVDRTHAIEEAGDLSFYAVALFQVLDQMDPINEDAMDELFAVAMTRFTESGFDLKAVQMEWLDLAKRWIGYGKAPTMSTTELMAEANAMLCAVMDMGAAHEGDGEMIVIANVKKLLKRYNGMVFDADRAVNRDLAGERAVLESATS